MQDSFFAFFETSIGRCALIWSDRGILGLQLPERDDDELAARVHRRWPGARRADPPTQVGSWMDAVLALMRGEPRSLLEIPLDMTAIPAFNRRVYEAARRIPPGQTQTYGEIARTIGEPHGAQAVGQALGHNPFAIIVPCHRVVGADGFGGFSAHGGTSTKMRMLTIEGAISGSQLSLF